MFPALVVMLLVVYQVVVVVSMVAFFTKFQFHSSLQFCQEQKVAWQERKETKSLNVPDVANHKLFFSLHCCVLVPQ